MVLLRLRVEQMWIKRVSEVRRQGLVLAEVVALEEVVEVGVVRVGQVKWVRRDIIAALGAELRRVVLRDILRRLEEAARVGKGRLLRKRLSLGGGEELGIVQPRAGDGVRGRVLDSFEAQVGAVLVLERRVWAGRGRVGLMNALARRRRAPSLLDVHDVRRRVPNNRWDVEEGALEAALGPAWSRRHQESSTNCEWSSVRQEHATSARNWLDC